MTLTQVFLGLGIAWTSIWSWFAISTIPAFKKAIEEGTPEFLIVPTILFVVCISIGIVVTVISLRSILANRNVDRKGSLAYGLILDVRYNNRVENYRAQYDAVVLLNVDGEPKLFSTDIGANEEAYKQGTYVVTKYYNDKVGIVNAVPDYSDDLRDFKDWAEQYKDRANARKQSDELNNTAFIGALTEVELAFFNKNIKKYSKTGIKFLCFLWMPFMAVVSYFVFKLVKTGEVGIIDAVIIAGFDLFGIFILIKSIVNSIFSKEKHFEFTRGRIIERKEIILRNARSYVSINIKLNDGRVLEDILMTYKGWVEGEYVVVAINERTKAHYVFNAQKNHFAPFKTGSSKLASLSPRAL